MIDPMAEATYHQSPFGYVGNNPVRNTDPTGMLSEDEYRKWAKEADALNDRAEQQGLGAYSSLNQDGPGPGDKNKKANQASNPTQQASAAGAAGAVLTGKAVQGTTATVLEEVIGVARAGVMSTMAIVWMALNLTGDVTETAQPEGNGTISLGTVPTAPPLRPLGHNLIGFQLQNGPTYWYHQTMVGAGESNNGDQLATFQPVSPRELAKFNARGMQVTTRNISNGQLMGANAAAAYLLQQGASPYMLFYNDCTTNCVNVLRGAGFNPPSPATPATLMNWFQTTR